MESDLQRTPGESAQRAERLAEYHAGARSLL
jgi:hypothetical protein